MSPKPKPKAQMSKPWPKNWQFALLLLHTPLQKAKTTKTCTHSILTGCWWCV